MRPRKQKFEKKKMNTGLGGCPSPARLRCEVTSVFGKSDSRLIYDKKEPELQEFTDSHSS